MRLIKPSYEILECPTDALLKIERAARICYKSEDLITAGSAEKLVRSLIKREHGAMLEFGGWLAVRFVSNRGFTHEMVRHRLCSFAQESTRYCNYSKGKFGGELTFCEPLFGVGCLTATAWEQAEAHYLRMLSRGTKPEVAREVLPIGLKAEIVVGANTREWMHIFGQRCSPKAHPRMRELMLPLLAELQWRIPVLFENCDGAELCRNR